MSPVETSKKHRPTVVDVARHANVSQGTVSRYLNGLPIKAENQERVVAAIATLNYSPNAVASAMRSDESRMIGLLVPDYDEFHARLLGFLTKTLLREGIGTLAMYHESNAESVREVLAYFKSYRVRAVVIDGTRLQRDTLIEMAQKGVRVITYDHKSDGDIFHGVVVNNRAAALESVEALLKLGHTRIAILSGKIDRWTAQERIIGWRDAFAARGLSVPEDLFVECDWSEESGARDFNKLWDSTNRPTAVFSSNYQMTMGILAVCRKRKIIIPDDISIISFGDIGMFGNLNPSISAVHQPVAKIAESLKEMITYKDIEGGSQPPTQIILQCELRLRDSIAAPSTGGS